MGKLSSISGTRSCLENQWSSIPGKQRKTPTIKARAFQASVFRHFNFTSDQREKHKYGFRIAYHHFQEEFLKSHSLTTLLTRDKVLALNKKADTTGYTKKVNCVSSLMPKVSGEKGRQRSI